MLFIIRLPGDICALVTGDQTAVHVSSSESTPCHWIYNIVMQFVIQPPLGFEHTRLAKRGIVIAWSTSTTIMCGILSGDSTSSPMARITATASRCHKPHTAFHGLAAAAAAAAVPWLTHLPSRLARGHPRFLSIWHNHERHSGPSMSAKEPELDGLSAYHANTLPVDPFQLYHFNWISDISGTEVVLCQKLLFAQSSFGKLHNAYGSRGVPSGMGEHPPRVC